MKSVLYSTCAAVLLSGCGGIVTTGQNYRTAKVATDTDVAAATSSATTFNTYAATALADLPTGEVTYVGDIGMTVQGTDGSGNGEAVGDLTLVINFATDAVTGQVTNLNIEYDGMAWQRMTGSILLTGSEASGALSASGSGNLFGATRTGLAVDIEMLLNILATVRSNTGNGDRISGTATGTVNGDFAGVVNGSFFGTDSTIVTVTPTTPGNTPTAATNTNWNGVQATYDNLVSSIVLRDLPDTGTETYTGAIQFDIASLTANGEAVGDLTILTNYGGEALLAQITNVNMYLNATSGASVPEQLLVGVIDMDGDIEQDDPTQTAIFALDGDGELSGIDSLGEEFDVEMVLVIEGNLGQDASGNILFGNVTKGSLSEGYTAFVNGVGYADDY